MNKNNDNKKVIALSRRDLLRTIHQHGSISRVQLAQKLQLGKSTVTENITQLMQIGVVQEIGAGAAGNAGGRRPVLLKVNGSYKYIVAAELGLHTPIVALADLNGKIVARHSVTLPANAPYAVRFRVTKEVIRQLLRDNGMPTGKLATIALSSPGAYSAAEKAFLLNPEFADWNVDKLTADLEEAFSTNVFRINDVNAAAVGEFYQGAGKGCSNLLFFSCGMGVGMGLVLNGDLYTGANGSSGEIARNPAGAFSKPLRTLVEIDSLLEKMRAEAPQSLRQAFGKPMEEFAFGDAIRFWQQKDAFVCECIQNVAVVLGESLASAVSLLNCELVVFGGDYLVFEEQIVPELNRAIKAQAFDPVAVLPSKLRQEAGLQGLLSMAAEKVLDDISAQRI